MIWKSGRKISSELNQRFVENLNFEVELGVIFIANLIKPQYTIIDDRFILLRANHGQHLMITD